MWFCSFSTGFLLDSCVTRACRKKGQKSGLNAATSLIIDGTHIKIVSIKQFKVELWIYQEPKTTIELVKKSRSTADMSTIRWVRVRLCGKLWSIRIPTEFEFKAMCERWWWRDENISNVAPSPSSHLWSSSESVLILMSQSMKSCVVEWRQTFWDCWFSNSNIAQPWEFESRST